MAVQTDKASAAQGGEVVPRNCCPKCDSPLRTPVVCEACNNLLEVRDANYFDLFGLPRRYSLDGAKLREAFRRIARSVHPDRFADRSAEAITLATRLSAEVNQAFHVLHDPVRRANYMLEVLNQPGSAQCREVPKSVLTEVMMIREDMEQARAQSDRTALDRHRDAIAQRREQTLRQITERAGRLPSSDEQERKELRLLLNSMKYYDNLMAELADDPLKG
jgi:molecular chaperone HscB